MSAGFQLLRIETADRAGVITSVTAALASRGVNIECFAACPLDVASLDRRGRFLLIVEAEADYAKVLQKLLGCLEVVSRVSEPEELGPAQLEAWHVRFARLME